MNSPAYKHGASAPALRSGGGAAVEVGLETVRATVTLLVPEYRQVHLETADGRCLAISALTGGVDLASLQLGQTLECVVAQGPTRVLSARTVA